MQVAGRRVAVTGAGGFIGSATCRRLADDGAEVVGLDVAESAAQRVEDAGARFVRCDVTEAAGVRDALARCSAVVHTAANISDWGPMEDFVRLNVRGTRIVLEAARDSGVERVVHLSSIASWGYEFRHDLDDESPVRTCGVPYVDTKAASDLLARRRGAVVVRPGDVYGPGSMPWTIRPVEALKAGRFAVPAGGFITPVYVDDVVDCIARALASEGTEGQAFTAWGEQRISARDFFGLYARMLGTGRVRTAPRPLLKALAAVEELIAGATGRPPTVSRWAIDYLSRTAAYSTARAREVLGWEPRVDLEEGMRRTEAWLREQRIIV